MFRGGSSSSFWPFGKGGDAEHTRWNRAEEMGTACCCGCTLICTTMVCYCILCFCVPCCLPSDDQYYSHYVLYSGWSTDEFFECDCCGISGQDCCANCCCCS